MFQWVRSRIEAIVAALSPLHPAERIEAWQAAIAARDWRGLAQGLLCDHYDPRYLKHRLRYAAQERAVATLDDLHDLDSAAARLEETLVQMAPIR